jgi:nucleoside-diphosphate-sugar epimerase
MTTNPSSADAPVLVTGGAGHLGANLVRRLLRDGHRVRVLLRPEDNNTAMDGLDVERVYGDLRDPGTVLRAVDGCGRVYHAAAKVSTIDGDARHKRDIYDCNVLGTRHVLDACKRSGVERVVVTGSFSAVGYDPDDPSKPADETMQFYPFHRTMPYERSKVLVEHECLKAVADGLDVVIATSCAILGGNDFLPSRMGRTLCDFANGKLRAYIDRGGFEFVAAQDLVEGHVLAMNKGRPGHKYIFSTKFLTLEDIMDLFEDITGMPRPRLKLPAPLMLGFSEVASQYLTRFHPSFPQRLTPGAIRLLKMSRHADTTKAQQELGYRPTDIRDAIREAYAFHYARGAITNPGARVPDLPVDSTPPTSHAEVESSPQVRA